MDSKPSPHMVPFDSALETHQHRNRVRDHLNPAIFGLLRRGAMHDLSKLEPEEKGVLDAVIPEIQGAPYGSQAYKAGTARLGPMLAHHYAVNSHHPEFFVNGIRGMTLLDLLEMLADWRAASERPGGKGFAHSLEFNVLRFEIPEDLANILRKSAVEFFWVTVEELTEVRKLLVDAPKTGT